MDAAAIRTLHGYVDAVLTRNDDGSQLASLGFAINLFGKTASQVYVNTNGNLTFNSAFASYTPGPLRQLAQPTLAPFFADIDTRHLGGLVHYGSGTLDGRPAFSVLWDGVAAFGSSTTDPLRLNRFQVVLVARTDLAAGDFDVEFNYAEVGWDQPPSGAAIARAGYASGLKDDQAYELPGSGKHGALLDGAGDTSLATNQSGSVVPGRFVFFGRAGTLGQNQAPTLDALDDVEVFEGEAVRLPVAGRDAENDPLVYRLSGTIPDGASIDETTGLFSFAATAGPAVHTITVQVAERDNSAQSTTQTFLIRVENVAPSVELGADALVSKQTTLSRPVSLIDPGEDNWTASVDYGDGSGVQPLALSGRDFVLQHVYTREGNFTVSVTVADGESSRSDRFQVVVLPDASRVLAMMVKDLTPGEATSVEASHQESGRQGQVRVVRSVNAGRDGAILVALYSSDPGGAGRVGEFFDVQMRNPHAEDVVEIVYRSPLPGRGKILLSYVDPLTGEVRPVTGEVTHDQANGTITFRITDPMILTGTVFTVSLSSAPVTTTSTVAPPVAQAGGGEASAATRAAVTFTSRTQLSLTVTAAQDRSLAPTGSTSGGGVGGLPGQPRAVLSSTSGVGIGNGGAAAEANAEKDKDPAAADDADKPDADTEQPGPKQEGDRPKAENAKGKSGAKRRDNPSGSDNGKVKPRTDDAPATDKTPNGKDAGKDEAVPPGSGENAPQAPLSIPREENEAEGAATLVLRDAVIGLVMPFVALGMTGPRFLRRGRPVLRRGERCQL